MNEAAKLAEALGPAPRPLYVVLAGLAVAMENCAKNGNPEWLERHGRRFHQLVLKHLPSGAGFNHGTRPVGDASDKRLQFHAPFQHTAESFHGWTDHTVTVRPSLYFGFTLTISGRNENEVKDYIHEVFDVALRTLIDANDKAVSDV